MHNTTQLEAFYANLISFDGGKRSPAEAHQICIDVSKFLAFCDQSAFSWESLLDASKIINDIEKLEKFSIGSEGILTKLDRIQTALKYIQREIPEFSSCSEVFKVLDRISLWKATFGGEKIQRRQLR